MHLIAQLPSGQGIEQGGWPGADNAAFINEEDYVKGAQLAKKGFTIRQVLAHGPINYHPIFLGTPESIANKFQQWFEAGVGKDFSVVPGSGLGSLTDFVEQVVPILQKRGLLRTEHTATTLREHLGLPFQNGLPEQVAKTVSATN
ncbi:hypothetical protein [Pontibacter beigongshangensis]|uniref:hypothetical protein n=1 Tax=Pontibacter beigongshangensis TaxID=2574733 RepID=UPI00164FE9FC|nr:hypothetical protein [Pontibacter beigongshangensis]